MNTLYISDLDGTMLMPDAALSAKTVRILNRLLEQGMQFSVATARSIASAKPILKDVKLSLPIILMNGVCIYDLNRNQYIKVEEFAADSKALLLEVIKMNRLKGFAYTIKNGEMYTYYEDLNTPALYNFYRERVDSYQKKFYRLESFTSLTAEPLMYFTLLDYRENLAPIYPVIEGIPGLNCVFYKDNYSPDLWYLEIFCDKASKYQAVRFLRESMCFDRVVCFGDNRNDFGLFEASDFKIAVDNAVSELKERADLVIGNHSTDSVAAWLSDHYISIS